MSTHARAELAWVRYDPRTALLRLTPLTGWAELAHRRLSDYIWSGWPWPAPDFDRAGQLTKVPPESWERVLLELYSVGWRTRKGRLYHPDVAKVRDQAQTVFQSRRTASLAANDARWHPSPNGADPENASPSPIRDGLQSNVSKRTVTNPSNTVNPAERLTLSGEAPKGDSKPETEFLESLHETLHRFSPAKATAELRNWGGWWRNRFRENPDKARRVLADVGSMVREHRIRRNPGAAGLDLWNRLP
jgi:hypothetical protein